MFAREGTHRGSIYRRSAASPQVLFLLEGSLTYHRAWGLRLAESWMPFHLATIGSSLIFISKSCRWFLAVTSELRSSPHSVCVVTRALSTELLLSPLAACGWDAVVLESVCLLFRARHWCRNPACTTHVVIPKHFGQRLHVITGLMLRGPSLLAVYLGQSGQSALDCFALQRLADSCSRRCIC